MATTRETTKKAYFKFKLQIDELVVLEKWKEQVKPLDNLILVFEFECLFI
jgi:hypothetical protein